MPQNQEKLQRWLTLLTGLVESLFFTGIAYGWASLVFVMKQEGYYAAHCKNTTGEEESYIYTDCRGQDEHFSQVMLAASLASTTTRFPAGYIFDRFGTTTARMIAILLFTVGTLLITLSSTDTAVLLYPAWSCITVAGAMLHMTNAQVGNLFGSYRCTIIMIYNGAVDSSAAVCLFIKLLYERGVSPHDSFLFLTLCNIFHLLRTIFLLPRGYIPHPLPESYTYGVRCCKQRKVRRRGEEDSDMAEGLKENKNLEKTDGDMEESFRSCMFSWLFICHLLFVVAFNLCQHFFLCTANPMLTRLARDQSIVSHYTNAFAIIQMCGLLFTPLSGLLVHRNKNKPLAPGETKREADLRQSTLVLFLTSLQCFLFSVCFTCPVLQLQYVTFILQASSSALFYGVHQAFISIAFPASHFGKLSGTAMSLSAVVLLLQFPLLHFIQKQLDGDPLYVNIGVTLVSLLSFTHPLQVSLYCRQLAKQRKTSQHSLTPPIT